jgi:hypothetical protein
MSKSLDPTLQECGYQLPPISEPTEGKDPVEHPLQELRKDECGNQVNTGWHVRAMLIAHCLPGYPARRRIQGV